MKEQLAISMQRSDQNSHTTQDRVLDFYLQYYQSEQ